MREDDSRAHALGADIERLLAETDEILWRQLDFDATDQDTTRLKIDLLRGTAELINIRVIVELGGRRGPVRAPGMVEGLIATAFQTFSGYDPHPDHFDKAAIIWRGITGGHPFEDGNKRTGFMTAWYYLQRAGFPDPSRWPVNEMISFGVAISAHTVHDLGVISGHLRRWWAVDATPQEGSEPSSGVQP